MIKLDIPYFSQSNLFGCSIASIRMILAKFGVSKTEKEIQNLLNLKEENGADLGRIQKLFDGLGFRSVYDYDSKNFEEVMKKVENHLTKDSPVIALLNRFVYEKITPLVNKKVSWENEDFSLHYVIITGIDKNFVYLNDPHEQIGKIKLRKEIFARALSEKIPWKFVFLAVNTNNFIS